MHETLGPLGRAVLEVLSRLSGGQDAESVEREARAHALLPKPVVTFVGAYSGGKSSLIKRLLVEDCKPVPPWLTVGATKVTFESRECEAFGCILRDTPGMSARDEEHERRARLALGLSDVIVVTAPPQLLTSERDAILEILSGRLFTPGGMVLPSRAAHVVVARMDEAGDDPLDDLVGYRTQIAGKLQELRDLLTRHGLAGRPIEVHALCADLSGDAASQQQPPRSFFARSRHWDGVASFGAVLSSLAAELPTLRAAALDRYFLLVANQARESLHREVTGQRLELDTCRNDMDRLSLLRDQLVAASRSARAGLDGIAEEHVFSAGRMHGLTAAQVAGAVVTALEKSLGGWSRDDDAVVSELAREADKDMEKRSRRPARPPSSLDALRGASVDGEHGMNSDPGGKWLIEGLRRFGPRVLDAVKSAHELALGISIKDAQRELARIDSLGSFQKYVKEAGKRHALRDVDHAAAAALAVRIRGTIAALGPLLVELASLYAERQGELRAGRERVQRLENLRSKIADEVRCITDEAWRDYDEQVVALQRHLDSRMVPLSNLESSLARVVSDLEAACERLAALTGTDLGSDGGSAVGTTGTIKAGKGADPKPAPVDPPLVVVSFADADREYVETLEKQLKLAVENGKVRVWHRNKLAAGTPLAVAGETLAAADVVVLLVSADYHGERLEEAQAAMRGSAVATRVIPVLVRATSTAGAPYEGLATLPMDGRALASCESQDEAWTEVVMQILEAAG